DQRGLGQLTHAYRYDFGGRNPQRHLVLDEIDDKQLKLGARDFLLFDGHDLTHAVGRIYDEFISLEALPLRRLLIAVHSRHDSFRGPLAVAGHLGCRGPPGDGATRGMGGPAHCRRLFLVLGSYWLNLSSTYDAFFLPLLTRGSHVL